MLSVLSPEVVLSVEDAAKKWKQVVDHELTKNDNTKLIALAVWNMKDYLCCQDRFDRLWQRRPPDKKRNKKRYYPRNSQIRDAWWKKRLPFHFHLWKKYHRRPSSLSRMGCRQMWLGIDINKITMRTIFQTNLLSVISGTRRRGSVSPVRELLSTCHAVTQGDNAFTVRMIDVCVWRMTNLEIGGFEDSAIRGYLIIERCHEIKAAQNDEPVSRSSQNNAWCCSTKLQPSLQNWRRRCHPSQAFLHRFQKPESWINNNGNFAELSWTPCISTKVACMAFLIFGMRGHLAVSQNFAARGCERLEACHCRVRLPLLIKGEKPCADDDKNQNDAEIYGLFIHWSADGTNDET